MQISAASFDGQCILCVVGEYTQRDADMLQETLEKMKKILLDFAEATT